MDYASLHKNVKINKVRSYTCGPTKAEWESMISESWIQDADRKMSSKGCTRGPKKITPMIFYFVQPIRIFVNV